RSLSAAAWELSEFHAQGKYAVRTCALLARGDRGNWQSPEPGYFGENVCDQHAGQIQAGRFSRAPDWLAKEGAAAGDDVCARVRRRTKTGSRRQKSGEAARRNL